MQAQSVLSPGHDDIESGFQTVKPDRRAARTGAEAVVVVDVGQARAVGADCGAAAVARDVAGHLPTFCTHLELDAWFHHALPKTATKRRGFYSRRSMHCPHT